MITKYFPWEVNIESKGIIWPFEICIMLVIVTVLWLLQHFSSALLPPAPCPLPYVFFRVTFLVFWSKLWLFHFFLKKLFRIRKAGYIFRTGWIFGLWLISHQCSQWCSRIYAQPSKEMCSNSTIEILGKGMKHVHS